MRRRLYILLPSVASARTMLDELLLARIEERYIHFYAKEGCLLNDMPEANTLMKTDVLHGVENGVMIGACSGFIAGSLLLIFPPESIELRIMALLISSLFGAIFGSWISGRAARMIPNSKLKPYQNEIEQGKVLLIADIPLMRETAIRQLVSERHPEAHFSGVKRATPGFL